MYRSFFQILIMLILAFATIGCINSQKRSGLTLETPERLKLGVKVKSVSVGQGVQFPDGEVSRALFVIEVKKGSLAEKMGMEGGDLLHLIDGHPVSGIKDSYALMSTKVADRNISVGIYRNGKLKTLNAVINN
ncbi:MAG: PDZ domain-containing protein [Desulfobacterales bacterium]|nr:PDZ domain-containing protein [Desulfobacterales bacterium]